jgi:hypothetical protein
MGSLRAFERVLHHAPGCFRASQLSPLEPFREEVAQEHHALRMAVSQERESS